MSDNRILWINTGGTLVSKAYDNPFNPPSNVEPLQAKTSGLMFNHLLHEWGIGDNIDGYSYRYDFGPTKNTASELDSFQKDSKDFNDDDITHLAEIIRDDSSHKHFLITHGTDKMAENASKLKAKLKALGVTDKTVVFAGSMVPLSMSYNHPNVGDARLNLEFAIEQIETRNTWVYVVGRDTKTKRLEMFDPDGVTKDFKASQKRDFANPKNTLKFTLKPRENLPLGK